MATCPNCGVVVNKNHSHCFKCGKGISGADVDLNNLPSQPVQQGEIVEEKYGTLSAIASFIKVLGWLMLIIGILVMFFSKGKFYEIMMGVYLVTGFIGAYMSAGIVHLLIDIERTPAKEMNHETM